MKKSLLFLSVFSLLVTACHRNDRFEVSGVVKDAAGEKLYLEHVGLMKTTTLDSVKLHTDGTYSFKAPRPAYPDFYDLRLGSNKTITFAVDSCEHINIDTQNNDFTINYKVTGSVTSQQIQQLRKSILNIQLRVDELTNDLNVAERNAKIQEIDTLIQIHKDMAKKLILQNPRSAAAYFAVYQKLNNSYVFSPYVNEDRPYCAAVATAYNAFMPDYIRTKNIYGLVMDAINVDRENKAKEAMQRAEQQSNTGYIDIALPDRNGKVRKLSELQGKVVLIDCSAYESDNSFDYTFALRDLYNKYHSRGLEIYQISLDQHKIVWEQSTKSIPWVCVRDENGPNTRYVSSYNVSDIPTNFLMNRQGIITDRNLKFDELTRKIQKDL
jgi:hypothetical protein